MSNDCSCKNCKKIHEHLSSLLPFKILEAVADKPLRIAGVAMAAGMSRNFNVYTPEELAAFAPLLVGAPVYIEHVAVDSAAGKVTKCTYDSASRCLLYEAEIYDPVIADKIRNGLIQHVSVGADYDALDLVDAKVPHGLSHPELSLVAVPGIPETNIQVLEHFLKQKVHEDKIDEVELLEEKTVGLIAQRVAEKISAKQTVEFEILRKEAAETKIKLSEAENKLKTTEEALGENKNQLLNANKALEDLRKQLPNASLFANPPVMMPVSEHILVLESLVPPPMVERSSMGMQRQGQAIRAAILLAKEKLRVK